MMTNTNIKLKKRTSPNILKYIRKFLLYVFSSIMTVIFMFPIYFLLVSSFKNNNAIFSHPFSLPTAINTINYIRAWEVANIGRSFLNSAIISVSSLLVCIFVGSMAAFILSKFVFKLRQVIYVYFLAGLMVPIQSIIIPLAYVVAITHLRDNYLFIILLFTALYLPFSTFIITGFMSTLPSSLDESAVLDGCNPFELYFKIILPLVKPALATVAIFVFMYTWNDLMIPLIFIGNSNLWTLSLELVNFIGQYQGDYGALMAAIVISIAPPLLMYILMQENVEKGLTAGALKG